MIELLPLLTAGVGAFVAGGLIPLQGVANRGMGVYVGSYPHAALVSLTGSALVLWPIVIIRLIFRPKENLLFNKGTFRWYYWLSGSPGAGYIAILPAAIGVVGASAATVSTVVGMMTYGVLFGKKNSVRVVCGVILTIMGTVLVVMGRSGVEVSRPIDTFSFVIMALTAIGGGLIAWQFAILAEMRGVSSILFSATMSSTTGALTAFVLVTGAAVLGMGPYFIPFNSWPPLTLSGLWRYGGFAAGLGIIPISAYAAAKLKAITKGNVATYPVVVNSGILVVGFVVDIFSAPMSATMYMLQSVGCSLAIAGVVLCLWEKKADVPHPAPVVSPVK